MSNLFPSAEAEVCGSSPPLESAIEALTGRTVPLGALDVHRVLPVRSRRLIGPWCFFDRYGPLSFTSEKPMDVAPHPHIGLQTVTWIFSGEVIHNDSLGNECLVRPGQLSLMTAGRGIAHTEETPRDNSGRLDGVQLWVALPDGSRATTPSYQCTAEQPSVTVPGGVVTAILGDILDVSSAGRQFSEGMGAEVVVRAGGRVRMPMRIGYEYGALLASGDATALGVPLRTNTLYYLSPRGGELEIASAHGATLLLIGGPPFPETILMWWNFVARTPQEIAAARTSWQNREMFGEVPRYAGPRIPAPEFAGTPIPRDR